MDSPQEQEDLSQLSDEALAELDAELETRGNELAEGDLGADDLDELESLADRRDAVRAEAKKREGEAEKNRQRAQSAIARLRGESVDETTDDDVETPDGETVEIAAAAEGVEVEEEVPVPVAASGAATPKPAVPVRTATRRGPGGLNQLRPPAAEAKAKPQHRQAFMEATGSLGMGVGEGTPFDSPSAVAKAISDKRNSWNRIPAGVHDDRVKIATAVKQFAADAKLGHDLVENFAVLGRVQKEYDPLVASGPFCTPLTPLYDFFRLAVPQTPVEDSLPVVQADRGGLRYITAICDMTDAFAGITTLTPAQNLDPEAPDLKACFHVGCPTVVEKVVSSVSTCIEFGNLQYRTFPELVENFLADVAVAFAITKETMYLDAIHAASVATTLATGTYGSSRMLLWAAVTAATAFRKRHAMRRDAPIQVWAPDWGLNLIKLDMAMEAAHGADYRNVTDAQVNDQFRAYNINVDWFADRATALADQKFNAVQAAGVLNAWPNTLAFYLTAPGTFVRLDGGTLDVGLVRDSTLNASNDLQLFMEEWLGIAQVGCEVERVTVTSEPSGAAPALVTPWTV